MSAGKTTGRLARSLARTAELASTRFPVAALLIVLFSALANCEVADLSLVPKETLGWWIAALYAAAAASVVAKLAMEARGVRPMVGQAASLAAALLVGGLVRYAVPLGVAAPALIAAVSFAIPLAPYVFRPDDRRFWTFTLWSGVGVVLSFLSVLLFTLGVSAILAMVQFLFDVGLGSKAYEHMYTTALTLVGPLIALGRVPADFDESIASTGEDRMAGGVRLLFDWVAAPLALATAIVLHLYAAKILLLGALPMNEVGWIVTSFLLFVLSMRIAADPFLETGHLFARLFRRAWAAMLVVPLGLLIIAIAERVGPEGWTLERYYLALGALAGTLVVVSQIVPALRARIRLIAAIPVVLLALSSVGPLGVGATVGRSQTARLSALIVPGGDAVSIVEERRSEARSRIEALADVGELMRAVALLPEGRRGSVVEEMEDDPDEEGSFSASQKAQDRVAEAFGAMPEPLVSEARIRVFASTLQPPLSVSGFDIALPERLILPGHLDASGSVGLALDGADLVLDVGGTRDRFPLRPLVEAVPVSAYESGVDETAPLDIALAAASGRTLRLRVQRLSLNDAEQAVSLTATLLLRRQDWPAAALFGGGAEAGFAEPGGAVGESAR